MATYVELRTLFGTGPLHDRMEVAVCLKAYAILQEATPSVARRDWAKQALQNPRAEADYLLTYALCANAALTVAQIQAATDAALLSNVGTAVDKLYT